MPALLVFVYATILRGVKDPKVGAHLVNIVLVISILSAGLLGAGVRAVQEREANILRRFKVTPPGAPPIVLSSLAAGLLPYMPLVAGLLAAGHVWLSAPIPKHPVSYIIFACVGLTAFRGIGLVIASVANSVQEAAAIGQVLFLPMLFLGGGTLPLKWLPHWLRQLSNFVPTNPLFSGLESTSVGGQSLSQSILDIAVLIATIGTTTVIAIKLFRWDKEEKTTLRKKLWIPVALTPFIMLGLIRILVRSGAIG